MPGLGLGDGEFRLPDQPLHRVAASPPSARESAVFQPILVPGLAAAAASRRKAPEAREQRNPLNRARHRVPGTGQTHIKIVISSIVASFLLPLYNCGNFRRGAKVSEIDWREDATLYLHLPTADGRKSTRAIQSGPLRWVLELALSGRYGPLSVLFIETESGLEIDAEMLAEAARKLDR